MNNITLKFGSVKNGSLQKATTFTNFCTKHNIVEGFKIVHTDGNDINVQLEKETIKKIAKYVVLGEDLGMSFYDLICNILDDDVE